jgi:hypothetical protein
MKTRTCLTCGHEIQGRTDKKFCDDQCRTTFNNRFRNGSEMVKTVNKVLRNNRSIIEQLLTDEKEKVRVSLQKLMTKGFNFYYHTHTYTGHNGFNLFYCYEYGYQQLEDEMVVLFKRTEP